MSALNWCVPDFMISFTTPVLLRRSTLGGMASCWVNEPCAGVGPSGALQSTGAVVSWFIVCTVCDPRAHDPMAGTAKVVPTTAPRATNAPPSEKFRRRCDRCAPDADQGSVRRIMTLLPQPSPVEGPVPSGDVRPTTFGKPLKNHEGVDRPTCPSMVGVRTAVGSHTPGPAGLGMPRGPAGRPAQGARCSSTRVKSSASARSGPPSVVRARRTCRPAAATMAITSSATTQWMCHIRSVAVVVPSRTSS